MDAPTAHPTPAVLAGVVLAATAVGALLGAIVPMVYGTDEVILLSITFAITPTSVALYAAVAVATFLLTLSGVFVVLSRFDEEPPGP